MERYKVILAYDGTKYHGSQYQAGLRTVQNVTEAALRKLNWSGKSILLAGRTDAGVHAAGQVAAFDLEWKHSLADLRNALNSLLPEDLAVYDVSVCDPGFHPRHDAISRTYRYHIYCQPIRNPTLERYAWRVWPRPDLARLQATSALFLGAHDFAGYGHPTSKGGSTIRNLSAVSWLVSGDELVFEITGNAFLYRMVRRMVYAQVMVGLGKLEMEHLRQHLDAPGDEPIQGLAPPQGLSLLEVAYPA